MHLDFSLLQNLVGRICFHTSNPNRWPQLLEFRRLHTLRSFSVLRCTLQHFSETRDVYSYLSVLCQVNQTKKNKIWDPVKRLVSRGSHPTRWKYFTRQRNLHLAEGSPLDDPGIFIIHATPIGIYITTDSSQSLNSRL